MCAIPVLMILIIFGFLALGQTAVLAGQVSAGEYITGALMAIGVKLFYLSNYS